MPAYQERVSDYSVTFLGERALERQSVVDPTNKIALLTGGKRIGRIVAEQLAARGADVALSFARSRTEAEEAAERVRAAGRRALVLQADLTSPDACRALVSAVAESLGGPDILSNMASVYVNRRLADVSASDWQAPIAVDLGAAFFCSQAAAPFMRARGGGRIINFSDWVVASGRPRYKGFVPYYV